MKKIYAVLALSAGLGIGGAAFADGNAFTPLNFDDTTYATPQSQAASAVAPEASADALPGNGSIQNAILQIDNAQVDIRNELLNYKTKYNDVDAQYKLVKNERKMLNKQVKSTEKRIKELDRAKEKMRKNIL